MSLGRRLAIKAGAIVFGRTLAFVIVQACQDRPSPPPPPPPAPEPAIDAPAPAPAFFEEPE